MNKLKALYYEWILLMANFGEVIRTVKDFLIIRNYTKRKGLWTGE